MGGLALTLGAVAFTLEVGGGILRRGLGAQDEWGFFLLEMEPHVGAASGRGSRDGHRIIIVL